MKTSIKNHAISTSSNHAISLTSKSIFTVILIATFLLGSCAPVTDDASSSYKLDIEASITLSGQTDKETLSLSPNGTTTQLEPCGADFSIDRDTAQLFRDNELLEDDPDATPPIRITVNLDTSTSFSDINTNTAGRYQVIYVVTLTEGIVGTAEPVEITFPLNVVVTECVRELHLIHPSTDFDTTPLIIPIADSNATPPSLVIDECIEYTPVLLYYENGVVIENKTISLTSSFTPPNALIGLTDEEIEYTINDAFGNPQTYTFTLSSPSCPSRLLFTFNDAVRDLEFKISVYPAKPIYTIPNCFTGTSLPAPTYFLDGVLDARAVITPPADITIRFDSTDAKPFTYSVTDVNGNPTTFSFSLQKMRTCERALAIQLSDTESISIPYVHFTESTANITNTNDNDNTLTIPQCFSYTSLFAADRNNFTNGVLYYEDGELIPESRRGYSTTASIPNFTHPEHGNVFSSGIVGQSDTLNLTITLDDIFYTGSNLTFEFNVSVRYCETRLYLQAFTTSTNGGATTTITPTVPTGSLADYSTNINGGIYYELSVSEADAPFFDMDDCSIFSYNLLGSAEDGIPREITALGTGFDLRSRSVSSSATNNFTNSLLDAYYSPNYYIDPDGDPDTPNVLTNSFIGGNHASSPLYVQLGGECTVSKFTAGDGTSTTTPYQISNAFLLQLTGYLVNHAYTTYGNSNFLVTSDIDMEITGAPWSSNVGAKGFIPIRNNRGGADAQGFSGTFDCGYTVGGSTSNYTISNLYINRPDENNTGLFGSIGTSTASTTFNLRNCNLAGANITGRNNIGGFVGNMSNAHAENLNLIGTQNILTGSIRTGGIFGLIQEGSLTSAEVNATVSGTTSIGGVTGQVSDGTLSNISMEGSISGSSAVGGIAGEVARTSPLTDITSSATVTSTGGTEGFNSSCSANECFGGVAGIVQNAYAISSNHAVFSNVYVSGDVLTPSSSEVSGVIGHIVSGNPSLNECGFSGNLQGTDNVGGILGRLTGSISGMDMTNCIALGDGSSTMISATGSNVGGLIGFYQRPATTESFGSDVDLHNNYSTYNIVGANNVGGLIGTIAESNTTLFPLNVLAISNSYALGNVTGTNNVGGLIGNLNQVIISNAYAGGDITGTSNVGGIAGNLSTLNQDNTRFTNLYASSTVSARGENVGGFFGALFSGSTLSGVSSNGTNTYTFSTTLINSYVSTTLSNLGTASWGGIAGTLTNFLDNSDSYFDSDRTGLSNAFGFDPPDDADTIGATTTTALQTPTTATGIYAAWTDTCTPAGGTDVSVWDFGTGSQYPALNCLSGGLTTAAQRMPIATQRTTVRTATLNSIPALNRTP